MESNSGASRARIIAHQNYHVNTQVDCEKRQLSRARCKTNYDDLTPAHIPSQQFKPSYSFRKRMSASNSPKNSLKVKSEAETNVPVTRLLS